jgi:hypothetical protein
MNPKMQLVLVLAESYHQRGTRLPVKELAVFLNNRGHRTRYGTPFKGKRPTSACTGRAGRRKPRWLQRLTPEQPGPTPTAN